MNEATTTLTPKDVAQGLHVAPETVVRAIEEGRLAAERIGDSYAITPAQLQAFMQGSNPFTAGVAQLPADRAWRSEDSDDVLMGWMQAGDKTAFEELYRRHYRNILAVCNRYLKGGSGLYEAKDLTHDAFLHAYTRIGQFRPGAPVKNWLVGIAVHACIDYLRRQGRIIKPPVGETEDTATEAGPPPVPGPTIGEIFRRRVIHGAVRDCLSALTWEEEIVVWARCADDETLKAIADSIGKTPSGVRVILGRALLKLRNCLRDKGFDIIEEGA